jgi:hypothetical protein
MAKQFSFSGCVAAARPCSGSASIATADIVIAVTIAAALPGSISIAAPTAATSGVRKGDWIIETGSATTGTGRRNQRA